MIYKNWKDLKPLTGPVPVGTKVVCIGGLQFIWGQILTVTAYDEENAWVWVKDDANVIKYKDRLNVALLPQSTMTEQERWQFSGIDLDACECVEHEGRRYPIVGLRDGSKITVLFAFGNWIHCCDISTTIDKCINDYMGTHCRPLSEVTPIPKKPQHTTRPWTQDEVLALLRKGGMELGDSHGRWVNAVNYQIEPSGILHICGWGYGVYNSYRSQETNWESRPLTKVVE